MTQMNFLTVIETNLLSLKIIKNKFFLNIKMLHLEPIVYDWMEVEHGEEIVFYPDCVEVSLLRFMHILFCEKDNEVWSVNLKNLKRYLNMEQEQCAEFFRYFQMINYIEIDGYMYFSDTGLEERVEWCSLLHSRDCFIYVHDEYELRAIFVNILNFFKYFFPKLDINHDIDYNSDEEISKLLEDLYNILTIEQNIKVEVLTDIDRDTGRVEMVQDIYIDEVLVYKWNIYHCYESITEDCDFLSLLENYNFVDEGHSELLLGF